MKKSAYRIPLLFLFICTFLCAQFSAFAASKETIMEWMAAQKK